MDIVKYYGCDIPYRIMVIIGTVINVIKFGIPIILIIMGMLDLGKAVTKGKEEDIKKEQQKLIKRAIAAALVFFVITITIWLLQFIGEGESTACIKCIGADIGKDHHGNPIKFSGKSDVELYNSTKDKCKYTRASAFSGDPTK